MREIGRGDGFREGMSIKEGEGRRVREGGRRWDVKLVEDEGEEVEIEGVGEGDWKVTTVEEGIWLKLRLLLGIYSKPILR